MKIKIVQPGWDSYTGLLGTIRFENGIGEATRTEAIRCGSTLKIAEYDEVTGTTGDLISPAAEIVRRKSDSAPVVTALTRGVDEPPVIGSTEAPAEAEEPANTEGDTPAESPLRTKEELEEIADAKGIAALREIAEPLGVRDTSIAGLIEKILKAQTATK
jgi:hypothetical protein